MYQFVQFYTNSYVLICILKEFVYTHLYLIPIDMYEIVSTILIVVYQFEHNKDAKKLLKSEKHGPHWSPGMWEYVENNTKDPQNTRINSMQMVYIQVHWLNI